MLQRSLSIVIPSHNRPDLLQLCLASLSEFAPSGTQFLVVDDGSRDSCISQVASQFSDVQILRNPQPLGFARAANRGIYACRGEVIELLNDDTQVTAGWANAALAWFDDTTIAAVAPLVLKGPTQLSIPIIDSAGDSYDRGGFASKRGHGERLSEKFEVPCEVFGASGSSAFYRAGVIQKLGGFPEDFGAYFEDVDLAWRIQNAGYRTMYEPSSRVWHRVGSSYRPSRKLIERQSQNEERVFWRNVPHARHALPRHAAVLAAKSLRRVREGTLVPWLFGRLRAWMLG